MKWILLNSPLTTSAAISHFFVNLSGHAMPIRSLTFSPDSQLLITASDDNHIKMYDVYHSRLLLACQLLLIPILGSAFWARFCRFISAAGWRYTCMYMYLYIYMYMHIYLYIYMHVHVLVAPLKYYALATHCRIDRWL